MPSIKSGSLNDRIAQQKKRIEVEAAKTPPGAARSELMKKLHQLDVTSDLAEWLSSPGIQLPR